jgi:hypothetical protein
MKRASYRDAISWLAQMDDNDWLYEDEKTLSVAASLVRDVFDVTEAKLIADLERELDCESAGGA